MAEERRTMQEVRVPDLLAALTAHGLGGRRMLLVGRELRVVAPATRRGIARRSTTQRGVMKHIARFFDWLNAGIAEGDRMRREAYLAQSSDHCDLEHRIRELERDPSVVRSWW